MFRKKDFIKALIIGILSLCAASGAFAEPSISNISGALTDGSTIVINGLNFGVNGPNIVLFDNFEGGTVGSNIKTGVGSATIGKWDRIGGGNGACLPKYDSAYKLSGNMAYKTDYTCKSNSGTDANTTAFVDNLNASDVFLSYWVYLPTTSSFPCYNTTGDCNWKMTWLYGSNTQYDDQVVPVGLPGSTTQPFKDWAISCNGCYLSHADWFSFNMYKGRWYRIWTWIHATGDSSGHKDVWVMGKDDSLQVTQKVNWNGQIFNAMGTNFLYFALSGWARWCNIATNPLCTESAARFDDVYLSTGSNARARVEIGNASTYNTCTNLAIATVTSWSNTQITATLRQGALSSISNAYVYLFDANGNVNQNGYPLCSDCPNNPKNLTVQ